jgi:hypothetical protein
VDIDQKYVMKVYRTITNNPTAAELDFLIEAHGKIGYMAAVAQGEAEQAESMRKYQDATTWRKVKDDNPKYTAAQVEAMVFIETFDYRKDENKKAEEAKKIANLLDSIRESINGIKYLGRAGGGDVRIGP